MTTAERLEAIERERAELETFAALAAHELLEPLVAIDAYATLARERLGDGADSTVHDLEGISRIATRTRHLVEALLHAVRPDGRPLTRASVSLDRVVADSLEILDRDLRARDVEVVAGKLPAVSGDESMLVSLFTNVLSNAAKYGPHGGRISVDALLVGDEWLVSIGSGGRPLGPEEATDIFEPFHRGSRPEPARGHGLGLAICRRIAERHGGRIGVVPGHGAGNTFVIALPA